MTTSVQPVTIDCEYLAPEAAAAFLMVEGDEAAFVETNTAHAVPRLLAALERAGRRPEDVRWVVITHVHLDHAGGASALLAACPNAALLAHPRAAPHAIDPTRLVASARKVYGDEAFSLMYGDIAPIPESRVRVAQDGEQIRWGSRTLEVLFTRGHANHHLCLHDSASDGVFTGDSFGLRYPSLQSKGLFVFPSTSPTDFDAEEARKSARRIADRGSRAYLTHFGEVTEMAAARDQLLVHLDESERILEAAVKSDLPDAGLADFCEEALRAHYARSLARHGLAGTDAEWNMLQLDLRLNGQGLAFVAAKKRAGKA